MPKGAKNEAKMDLKSMRFCDFSKIVENRKSCSHCSGSMVLEVPGTQKRHKNQSKIDAKSMLEKGVQK